MLKTSVEQAINQINSVVVEAKEHLKKTITETIQQPNNTVANVASVSNPPTQTKSIISSTVSSFLTEEKDRERRRLNLILHGVPESNSENIQTRKDHDSTMVQEIFDKHLGVSATIANPIRLGPKSDKPRLIRISVSSDREKANIPRNCTKLRGKDVPDPLCKVYICPDLTPKEREINKELRDQLKNMNKDGKVYQIKNGRIVQRMGAI